MAQVDYDVVVVGGGPAGTTAAKTAMDTAGDLDVVLFDEGTRREDRDGIGADSTDAAGQLRYWMEGMPDWVVECFEENMVQRIDNAVIYGGRERRVMQSSRLFEAIQVTDFPGAPADTIDEFGMTFDRPGVDDSLLREVRDAAVTVRIGDRVSGVDTDWENGEPVHTVSVVGDEPVRARFVILADGPKRRVTMDAVSQFVPDEVASRVDPRNGTVHSARQLYLDPPSDADWVAGLEESFQFFWGYIPGHTSYPWVFPVADGVYELGVTRPTQLDTQSFTDLGVEPRRWPLLEASEDAYPGDRVILERLYERVLGGTEDLDALIASEYGKHDGRETYVISSMEPFDSPVEANIAVTGGAGGFTSAFHEGGDHVAVYTGELAGRLIGEEESVAQYNRLWKRWYGGEVCGNIAMARMADDFTSRDYERAFAALFGGRPETAVEALDAVRYGGKAGWLRLTNGHDFVERLRPYVPDGVLDSVWEAVGQSLAIEETDYVYPA